MNSSEPKPQPLGKLCTDLEQFEKDLAASSAKVCSCFDNPLHLAPERGLILAALAAEKERRSPAPKESP